MIMIERIKDKEFLSKNLSNLDIVKKLKRSPRALAQFVKIYNCLCPACKALVVKDSNTPLDKYCPVCQEKARKHLEKVASLLDIK